MQRMMLARAAVIVALGCGAIVGPSRAQAQGPYPRTPPQATELPPGVPPVNSAPSERPWRDHVQHGRPLGCWSSFNGYGCSSLHSELGFIFGSCRMFFGEPCLKGAPPSALPPYAGPVSGYGPNSHWGHQAGYGVGGPGATDANGPSLGQEPGSGKSKPGLFNKARAFWKKCNGCNN